VGGEESSSGSFGLGPRRAAWLPFYRAEGPVGKLKRLRCRPREQAQQKALTGIKATGEAGDWRVSLGFAATSKSGSD
jgi:hypothetical protein